MNVYMRAYAFHSAITLILWGFSKDNILSFIFSNPLSSITQICALLGAGGYFLSAVLSSRLPFLETIAPLDQLYKAHRTIGSIAMAGILFHVSTLILKLLPLPTAITLYLLPGTNFSYNAGILTFHLLVIMLFTTIYLRLPYHVWKIIHKITSIGIIFATLHILLIPSDVSTFLPLRMWLLSTATIGILAWIYREFLFQYFAKSFHYEVIDTQNISDITLLTLKAKGEPMPLQNPGSFAFFSFLTSDGHITQEEHPFTILEFNQNIIKVAIKALGDYTNNITETKKGTLVKIIGPHGDFGKNILQRKEQTQVWIAGGIGITPFYSILSYLKEANLHIPNLRLYYSTSAEDILFHPQILALSKELSFSYVYVCSSKQGRMKPVHIIQNDKELKNNFYCLCGPKPMIIAYSEYLLSQGISKSNILTEEFDFKTLDK